MLVYRITNTENNKSYVGITTRNIERRWYEHKYVPNSCGKLLAKAIKKYGENAFVIEHIASAIGGIDNLKELEKQLINQCGTMVPQGYNLTSGGDGVFGFKQSEAQKKHNGDLKRGTKHSEQTKEKMKQSHLGERNHFFGKQHSEESKQKIALAKTGKVGPWVGKQRSEETKRKISEALKIRNQKGII